jgi:hypothetical protein
MRSFWLFRSNLIPLEYYHDFTELSQFRTWCHDYYLLLPLWMVENDHCDEVIIWRLCKGTKKDIVFEIGKRKFIQRWVRNFSECLKYPSPDISFFRGGFQEYDRVTQANPLHFGKKLYLGAGRRIMPQYGGKYDTILYEDERDVVTMKRNNFKCAPFFKTASNSIFRPLSLPQKYDICWPANFAQIRHKGQEDFIRLLAKYELHDLKVVSCGNKPDVGKRLCKKHGISNIEFMGNINRPRLNEILNLSAFGLNMSNQVDGCPRVSTEVLMSGTPLIVRDSVRLLKYYKKRGVVEVNENNFANKIMAGFRDYDKLKKDIRDAINNELSFEENNKKNLNAWRRAFAE